MSTSASFAVSASHDGAGVEIRPGAVVVDLTTVDLSTLTVSDLAEAFDDAEVQLADDQADPLDLIGDLDISPL